MPPPAEGFASRIFLGPALRTQSDRRLVTLVREGYESAFEEIVRRYGKALTRYAGAIVGNRSEDVTQDAFSKALLALRRDDSEIELRPWLYRIVRNTALNDLRDSPPSPEVLAEAIAGGRSAAEEAEQREELTELIERLRALPEPQRAAIVMRELEGLSHEEIAAALGLNGGAARQAIYRARQTLRDSVGMLLPLPLLKLLLVAGATGTAEMAAGATAGAGGAAGAGMAAKGLAATVLVVGAVGTGVALHDGKRPVDRPEAAQAAESRSGGEGASSSSSPLAPATETDRSSDGGDDGGRGENGDERSNGSSEPEPEDDRGGRGERGDDHGARHGEPGDDRHGGPGPSGHSGPGRGGSGETELRGGEDHSGPGGDDLSNGSNGSGGGDHSGPGGGGDSGSVQPPPPPPPAEEAPDGSSGSGSGGSNSSSGAGDLGVLP